MSDGPSDLEQSSGPHDARQHAQLWVDVISQTISEISGAAFPCAVSTESPADLSPAPESDLWITAACSGLLRGEMSLRLPLLAALRLAQIFMSEPANPSAELSAEYREAVLEFFRQVGGLAASALRASRGEVQLRFESSAGAPTWPPSSQFWLRLGEESSCVWIELQLSAALVATLRPDLPESASPEPARSELPRQSAAERNPQSEKPGDEKMSLDLLLDVELAVTLRFGSRRLLLREVLDLNPGSVVGLDRQVQEPADMLLDGRVVARGEVVVVDGNYGFRVTEVGPAV